MTYELAKQLKEAGFPQHHPADGIDTSLMEGFAGVSYPLLEELIEACKGELGHDPSFKIEKNGFDTLLSWKASIHNFSTGEPFEVFGSTPTEAVAQLWLALYAKV